MKDSGYFVFKIQIQNMFPASHLHTLKKFRWLQMITVKDCSKLVDGDLCPCANVLRKKLLNIPSNIYTMRTSEEDILKHKIKYNKCFYEDEYTV